METLTTSHKIKPPISALLKEKKKKQREREDQWMSLDLVFSKMLVL